MTTSYADTTTLLDPLRRHSQLKGDQVAYTFLMADGEHSSVTYHELDQHAQLVAHRLLEQAEPGDRALLMYHAGIPFIEAFLGCLYAGIVAVPAYPPKRNRNAERISAIAEDCSAAVLLCSSDTKRTVQGEFAESVGASSVIVTTEIDTPTQNPLPQLESDQLGFLQYTSGSTADPKGVMVTHRNMVANELLMQKHWGFSEQSVMVSWLPMFHDMGLLAGVLAPLFVGFPAVLMAPTTFLRRPACWLEAISDFKGTVTGAPNFAWDLCATTISDSQASALDLSSLKIASNGGEPVRASTYEAFCRKFAVSGFQMQSFAPSYGMAEATLLISGVPYGQTPNVVRLSQQAFEKNVIEQRDDGTPIVSCGPIGPGLNARIVDPEARCECHSGQIGEIWLHGDSIARGYWRNCELNQTRFRAKLLGNDCNWFRTGDLGFLKDDELYVTGRLKDLVIIRGRNIYPQDVEQVVEKHLDFVKANSCAAFSIEVSGEERIVVAVEGTRDMVHWPNRTNGATSDMERTDAAISRCHAEINDKMEVALSDVVFIRPTKFPRTSSGKVQRRLAKEQSLRGEHILFRSSELFVKANGGSRSSDSKIANSVKCVVREVSRELGQEPCSVSEDTRLKSLPLDSLTVFDLARRLGSALGIPPPHELLFQTETVGELIQAITATKPAQDDADPAIRLDDSWESSRSGLATHGRKDAAKFGNAVSEASVFAVSAVPGFVAAIVALLPLGVVSSTVAKCILLVTAPFAFSACYLLLACSFGALFSGSIVPGTFRRSLADRDYRFRRFYGAAWSSLYYFGFLYNLVLGSSRLKFLVFRAFGYRGSTAVSIYPDTWIRDLPLLELGEDSYVANKATLGTNLPLQSGEILVGPIRIGAGAMIGHLAMIGAGTEIGNESSVGHGAIVGVEVKVGPGTVIGPRSAIESFVRIGERCRIGTSCMMNKGVTIGDDVVIPDGVLIQAGVRLRTQTEADEYLQRSKLGRISS